MDLLSLLGGCSLLVSAHCATPQPTSKPVTQWHPMVSQAASMFALPEAWVAAVMRHESGGHTELNGRPITSKAGAMGLMQLMPKTYDDLRRQDELGGDPLDLLALARVADAAGQDQAVVDRLDIDPGLGDQPVQGVDQGAGAGVDPDIEAENLAPRGVEEDGVRLARGDAHDHDAARRL